MVPAGRHTARSRRAAVGSLLGVIASRVYLTRLVGLTVYDPDVDGPYVRAEAWEAVAVLTGTA